MASPVLQFRRGPSSNVGTTSFRAGEPGFTTDKYDFYIGLDNTTSNNKFFGSARYWTREDGTSSAGLKLVDKDGIKSIVFKSPNTISGTGVTYTFPGTVTADYFLKTDASGVLSWSEVDLTLGLNADTGGPSTVSTSQTLTIQGTTNEVNTSVSGQTVTVGLPDTVNITTALDVPSIEVSNIKARDGSTSITISDSNGNVGINSNLTVTGNLYVLGTTTEVNTTQLKVEDTLIDLGLVNDNGNLVAPSSDSNIDIGILMNWYSGITTSAKKAAVYWDDSAQRISIASDVSESSNVITASSYAEVEIGSLWVTDCSGTSQVISCTSSERFLNNITVDAGTF